MAAKYGTRDKYWEMSGTSMSTPFVARLVALLLDLDESLRYDSDGDKDLDVKDLLIGYSVDFGEPIKDTYYYGGRVDALNYVNYQDIDYSANNRLYAKLILNGLGFAIITDSLWKRYSSDWYRINVESGYTINIWCIGHELDIKIYILSERVRIYYSQ